MKTLRPENKSSETFIESGKEKNSSQRKYNLSLKEYINIRMVSIVETSEHAAKKPKPGNANQKQFERIMIMEYELTGIGKIKMTVGVRRRTLEKVQYCITAISSE